MKRIGNLFNVAFSRDSLYRAYLQARKGKRGKRACFEFEKALGANLEALYQELQNGAYQPRPYFKFEVYEPKRRVIYAPAFRDCVVQHAVYEVVAPIFDRGFIHTSFACRKGKGTHKASGYAQGALRANDDKSYFLQLDIRKFFYRINRAILQKLIERKIKDIRLVEVMMLFAQYESPIGIPIGNLLSQLYALIYLNPLDQFIKRELKVKWYTRYVDDFVLFGLTRKLCLDYRIKIVDFIKENLSLELSKSTIQQISHGINFVGYRTWKSYRLIRKFSLYKFRKCLRKNNVQAVISLLAHARRTRSLNHLLTIAKELNHGLYLQLPKKCRCLYHASA